MSKHQEEVDKALEESAGHNAKIKGIIEEYTGGKVRLMDNHENEVNTLMDRQAGIDGWLIHESQWYGLAIRNQYGKSYGTFSIRVEAKSSPTEKEKLINFVKRSRERVGVIGPALFCQFYWESKAPDSKLIEAGITRVEHIVDYMNKTKLPLLAAPDGNQFHPLSWKEMMKEYKVEIIK